MSRKFLQGAAGWLAGEFISTWVWVPAITGVGVVVGWAQAIPWFYLYVGGAVLFAAVSTGMLRFGEWRQRNRVEHKIRHMGMRINAKQKDDRIASVQFGLNLHNTAAFPLNYRVRDLTTKITLQNGNRIVYPPKQEYLNDAITLAPGAIGFFDDHEIPLPPDYHGDNNVAELSCRVLYGRSDRFDHELELKKKTFLHFVGAGISGGQHWYDQ